MSQVFDKIKNMPFVTKKNYKIKKLIQHIAILSIKHLTV